MQLLVTGGTGTLGRVVTRNLLERGHRVRTLSRRPAAGAAAEQAPEWRQVDLRTGVGLAEAVRGVDVIMHCATDARSRSSTDADGTHNLVEACQRTGQKPHLIYVSIVGVDRVPLAYYRCKLATERVVESSGLPWTTLRATQFHDLLLTVVRQLTRLPVIPSPAGISVQPVDVADVASRLVQLADGSDHGRVDDFGGPQIHPMADLIRAYLRASGRRRLLLDVPVPGATARAYRDDGHLVPDHACGQRTWAEFLAAQVGPGDQPDARGR